MPKRIRINGISKYPPVEAIGKFERMGKEQGKIVATNIPSQYARAEILSREKSQAFSDPVHSGLIRID